MEKTDVRNEENQHSNYQNSIHDLPQNRNNCHHHNMIVNANFCHCCCKNHGSCCCKNVEETNYSAHVPITANSYNNHEYRELKLCAHPQSSDIVDGLLRYNSNLTKYLHKYTSKLNNQDSQGNKNIDGDHYYHRPNTGNIIQDYNLNILPESVLPKKEKSPQNIKQQAKTAQKQYNSIYQQTSPRNNKKGGNNSFKDGNLTNKQKMEEYIQKDLRKSSRYLSNTGFRKYFNRQCFENYGRQNTNGVADGIVYNGYLKTHNVNPHSGGNLGTKEQVYHHALISADIPKLSGEAGEEVGKRKQLQIRKNEHRTEILNEGQNKNANREQDIVQNGTLLQETTKHHKEVDKYKHLILKSPSPKQVLKDVNKQIQENSHNLDKKYGQKNNEKGYFPIKQKQQQQNKQIINQRTNINEGDKKPELTEEFGRNIQQTIRNQNNFKKGAAKKVEENEVEKKNKYTKIFSHQQILQQQQLKKQIIEKCYYNSNIADSITKIRVHQEHPCPVCVQRRFTHCCCIV